jgi:hypothetical protein
MKKEGIERWRIALDCSAPNPPIVYERETNGLLSSSAAVSEDFGRE